MTQAASHSTRRTVLRAGLLAGAGALATAVAETDKRPGFRHRGYTGWITDLDSRPDPDAEWPSMRLDEPLLADYRQTFRLMRHVGYNEAIIWGFYVARNWPLEIRKALSPERGALVEKLIGSAHRENILVYTGLGVYSWGFEEIIKSIPKLSRGNPQAMCASEPEAWTWMQRAIDYSLTRLPVDGVSLQSADQGRCNCPQCRAYTDTEYHARLNVRVCGYIRSRWPKMKIAVSGWGMRFDEPRSLPHMIEMSRYLDYIIDVPDSTGARDDSYRRKVAGSLACDFGTLGGPQVEPPQHWARDRWFLPTPKRDGEHLAALYADGGRACDYFYHILQNPGDEITFWVTGRALAHPEIPWQNHLKSSIEELYRTTRTSTVEALAAAIVRCEEAYCRHLPSSFRCGTLSLEPLVGNHAGPPVYLTRRLDSRQRAAYRKELEAVRSEFARLAPDVPEKARMERISRSIANVLGDIDQLG